MCPSHGVDNDTMWLAWLRSFLVRGGLRSALPPRSLDVTKLEPPATSVATPYALQGIGATGVVEWTPAGGLLFVYRGAWSAPADYLAYDVVLYAGSTWRAVVASTNVAPVAYGAPGYGVTWELIAAAGSDADVTAHEADTTAHAASSIVNTPAGGIAAASVQGALDELDGEKLALSGGTMTGALAAPDATVSTRLVVPKKAGVPVDGDYASPVDGVLVLDVTNDRLYARTNGVWKYAALT